MGPSLRHGDHILALRWPQSSLVRRIISRALLRRGTVVIVCPPLFGGRTHIKRIGGLAGDVRRWAGAPHGQVVPPGHIFLVGDHPGGVGFTLDSRSYGPCPESAVFGSVVSRVWPPCRTGRAAVLLVRNLLGWRTRAHGQILIVLSTALVVGCASPSHGSPVIVGALGDGRVVVAKLDADAIAEYRVDDAGDRPARHVLAASPDRSRIYALVPGTSDTGGHVLVLDASGQLLRNQELPKRPLYRALAVGLHTGRVYLFGNDGEVEPVAADPTAARSVSVVVAALDPTDLRIAALWRARDPNGFDWLVYQGAVTPDERRVYISYHGVNTTGIDWFDVMPDGLRRCQSNAPPNRGCIVSHGGLALVSDGRHLLAATGTSVIGGVDPEGQLSSAVETGVTDTHLMEFAVDAATSSVYAISGCGTVSTLLSTSRLPGTRPAPVRAPNGDWQWAVSPTPPASLAVTPACGERVSFDPGVGLAVARPRRPVLRPAPADPQDAILLIDVRTGAVRREIPVPGRPEDVLIARSP